MAKRRLGGIVLVSLALTSAACGDDGPAAGRLIGPSPIPGPGSGPPAGSNLGSGPISGIVSDTAFRPLPGARVEALDGPRAGTTANANAGGEFSFPGTFDNATRFQASMQGHVAAVATVDPRNPTRWINFYLALPEGSVNMAGEYSLTITADGACTDLPTQVRTRAYAAIVTPSRWLPTYFEVLLAGAPLLGRYEMAERSSIAVAGNYVALQFGGGEQPALVEQLSPTSYVAFGATASASTSANGPPASIATSFKGFIDYCEMTADTDIPMDGYDYRCDPPRAVAHVRCESQGHRLTLTRR